MKAQSNYIVAARVLFESIVWILVFLFIVGVIGLAFNIWESPRELLTFLGTGRTN